MILRLIRQSELGDLLGLVSPSLFDVISVPAVLRRGRAVMADSRRTWTAEHPRLDQRVKDLASLKPAEGALLHELPDSLRAHVGQRILTLYFRQLYSDAPTALDLRAPSWRIRDERLHWAPASVHARWDSGFIAAMRGVYRGFYDGDDDAFVVYLGRLGLDGAADLFRTHIGTGDPHAHTFDRGAFVTSFGAIFEHCKEAGVRLHPDFVLLGAYLGGLYDSLAELDVPLDVATAFRTGSSWTASAA